MFKGDPSVQIHIGTLASFILLRPYTAANFFSVVRKGVDISAGVRTWSHEYATDPAAGNGNACLDPMVGISCFGHGL